MGALLTRVKIDAEIHVDEVLADLSDRTGLRWRAEDERLADGTLQTRFVVEPFGWEVVLARTEQGLVEVEAVPVGLLSINYHLYQLLASLARMGGMHVSRDGGVSELLLPKWVEQRWADLPWWRKLSR